MFNFIIKLCFRSYYVKKMWVKNPPQPPQPPASPKSHRRCRSAPHNPVSFVPKVDDYKSVYQSKQSEAL